MRYILPILLLLAGWCNGANHYVRQGASGTGSGDDWTNAYTTLPSTLTRGDTYYVADGSYAAYTFDDAVDSTTVITIKKATASDHGTETGWSSTYGDGQAVFSQQIKFSTGYWVFDGAVRDEGDWFDGTAYGFKVALTDETTPQVKIGTQGGAGAASVQIRYTWVEASPTLSSSPVRSYQIDMESNDQVTGIVISRCLVTGGNNHFFCRTTNGTIIEYCGSEGAVSNANNHGENVNWYFNTPNSICRYNIFRNNFLSSGGTAVIAIVTSANCAIYGNVFYNNAVTDGLVGWTGTNPGYEVDNLKFYNNTIDGNGRPGQFLRLENNSTGAQAYNNIFVDFGFSTWAGVASHNYNSYDNGNDQGEANGEGDFSTATFVNFAAQDYRLAEATTAGISLSSPYNQDRTGITRGTDGTWDRGALEFQAGGSGSSMTIGTATVGTLNGP